MNSGNHGGRRHSSPPARRGTRHDFIMNSQEIVAHIRPDWNLGTFSCSTFLESRARARQKKMSETFVWVVLGI